MQTTRSPIVWVPNLGPHDYSPAKQFGELRFLTKGYVNRFEVGAFARDFAEKMEDCQPQDFLMLTSLPVLCSIASSILVYKTGRLNLLTYNGGEYTPKEIFFPTLLGEPPFKV